VGNEEGDVMVCNKQRGCSEKKWRLKISTKSGGSKLRKKARDKTSKAQKKLRHQFQTKSGG